jgi:preprotein translocase subunit SecG
MILNVLGVIQVVSCLILILTILLQKGATQGLGAISGGADTFYGKNKNTGIDAILAKITTFFCVIFVILSLILCVLS